MNNIGNGRTVCSFCGEEIAMDVKRCPYCGSVLGLNDNFKTDDVKTDNFDDKSSQMQDINTDMSKSLFNDTIKRDKNVDDFASEEKLYYAKNEEELPETKPDEQRSGGAENFENQEGSGISSIQAQIPQEERPVQKAVMGNNDRQQSYSGSIHAQSANTRPSLSNGMKVFITSICSLVPGLGQLAGVITAIVFMNSEGDTDKRSFGLALLVNSLIVFVVMSISCCVLAIAFSET